MVPATVEELQDRLRARGKSPDGVQWEGDPQRTPQDGVYIVSREEGRVRIAMVSRDHDIGVEHFEDEAAAVQALYRRLVESEGGQRSLSAAERESVRARMQAKASAESARRRERRDG